MRSKEQPIDKRLAERLIAQGQLDPGEYSEYLQSLPDVSDKCEYPVPQGEGAEQSSEWAEEQ